MDERTMFPLDYSISEKMVLRHLVLNDPGFISMYLDIPLEHAKEACDSFGRMAVEFDMLFKSKPDRIDANGAEFDRMERQIIKTLFNEKQKHE